MSSDESLVTLARLVREFHDLTAGSPLAGAQDVVCHNDLSPKNTVYRLSGGELRPTAFIDWDLAAPGARIHDLAHVCWQYLDLGPSTTDVDEATRRMSLIVDSYEADGYEGDGYEVDGTGGDNADLVDRQRLVPTILWWQDRCWRGINAQADAGDAAMARLRDAGAVRQVQAAYQWVSDHRAELQRFVR
ncbi:phosphotransferase [Streptomyces sp. NPDC087294]|uniref:phosphotransferase n=1 Tax=Streptomyces sp. NPDC087294 TaxID=3365777 RepID=UPI003822DA17